MIRCSNSLVGILNAVVIALSIPILGGGIWLSRNTSTECERFLDKPIIALGAFLMIIAIVGLVGACCGVTWLMWIYLCVMFLLIVLMFCFTIFAFVVTNKGAGEALSNRGYKEYRLGDYSNWLQDRVNSATNWNRIKSCLAESMICTQLESKFRHHTAAEFYKEDLSPLQSGCCKPSNDCGFTYESPTNWTRTPAFQKNPDCRLWDNNPDKLCFECRACKAGLLDNIKSAWKKVAIVNIVVLVFLIIVYSVGCCAFRNNRRDDVYSNSFGFNKP